MIFQDWLKLEEDFRVCYTCTLKDGKLALPQLVRFSPVLVQRSDVHQVAVQPSHLRGKLP